MKKLVTRLLFALTLAAGIVQAAADLDISSPAINNLKASMASRHNQLAPHYASGALGVARDGTIQLRDANLVPLPQRQAVAQLVAAENQDRAALYREIARANNNPQWESEIRQTFAQRWVDKAQSGWYVQTASGWSKK